MVSGSIFITVKDRQNRTELPDYVTGEIVLLPLIESLSHRESVRLVLEDVIGTSVEADPAPEWVDSIVVPNVTEINQEGC